MGVDCPRLGCQTALPHSLCYSHRLPRSRLNWSQQRLNHELKFVPGVVAEDPPVRLRPNGTDVGRVARGGVLRTAMRPGPQGAPRLGDLLLGNAVLQDAAAISPVR